MPNAKNKRPVNVDKSIVERFEYLYPRLKEIFLNRCLDLAINDTKFFNEVFFNKKFMNKE